MRAVPAIALPMLSVLCANAVIVDRIAITVGVKAITDSEIDRRIRLTAFQNGEKPDFSLASRRTAAQRLIDQRLVEREMEVGRYPLSSAGTGKTLLADYEKNNYASSQAGMDAALHAYGLTEQDLEEELTLQSDMLTFLNLRFRPAVQVTDRDVRSYIAEHSPGPADAAASAQLRAAVEQKLTIERAEKELDTWLRDQRTRTKIQYNEKDLAEQSS